MGNRYRGSALLLCALWFPLGTAQAGGAATETGASAERLLGAFSQGHMNGWEPHSFKGKTDYELVTVDEHQVLRASCNATASGLFFRDTIDLRETPILRWSWRVDETFSGIDESTRAGDDFPARIYVVRESTVLRWRTRAINYVWASEKPRGSDWPNPYASQARMVALRSGPPDETGTWHTEEVNVREDFKRLHGQELDSINAVAIMTDCDDTGGTARAWFGDISFTAEATSNNQD